MARSAVVWTASWAIRRAIGFYMRLTAVRLEEAVQSMSALGPAEAALTASEESDIAESIRLQEEEEEQQRRTADPMAHWGAEHRREQWSNTWEHGGVVRLRNEIGEAAMTIDLQRHSQPRELRDSKRTIGTRGKREAR